MHLLPAHSSIPRPTNNRRQPKANETKTTEAKEVSDLLEEIAEGMGMRKRDAKLEQKTAISLRQASGADLTKTSDNISEGTQGSPVALK